MSAIPDLLKQRQDIYTTMLDLKTRAKTEDRSLSEEEKTQWDKAFADFRELDSQIEDRKKDQERDKVMEDLDREMRSVFDMTKPSERKEDKELKKVEYKTAFNQWFRDPKNLTPGQVNAIIEKRGTNTQITGTDGLGGYIVPDEWVPELIKTMEDASGMLEVSRIITTSHGRQMHIPTVPFAGGGAAATQKGARIGENTGDTVNDINLLEKLLDAYVYTSGEIQWTWEMMADSMFPVVPLTLEIGGDRIGRIVNEELTTGTGTSQPNGVVTASTAGPTTASGTAITADELVDLKHSVNRAYRRSTNCRWMFNDSTLGYITKLSYGVSDTAVWVPSFRPDVPDQILGFPFTVNDDMADIALNSKSVLFGDFNKYWVRKAGFPEVARSDERDMANRRSVFYVFGRYDGELVDANAIYHLLQAAA